MGPKKGRRVRKIEVPTGSVPEFELGDTASNIQRSKQERGAREREEAQQQKEDEARKEEEREKHTRKTGSCMTRLMDISKTKQGRSFSGRGSPTVASCLSKCARPGLSLDMPARDQNWIQDKYGFLGLQTRHKGLSKS